MKRPQTALNIIIRDGSGIEDGLCPKSSKKMAHYMNSVEMCQFSYIPDTPPSIFLYIQHLNYEATPREKWNVQKAPKLL